MAELLAIIDEKQCVGCTKCIDACPFDAIIGSDGFMHTVIESECAGCKLCISPCPVDCITLIETPKNSKSVRIAKAQYFKKRHSERTQRLNNEKAKLITNTQEKMRASQQSKLDYIANAIARKKHKQNNE